MGDVTDRAHSKPRSGFSSLGRGSSFAKQNSAAATIDNSESDIKSILSQVELLPRSASLSNKEVEEIIQSTSKNVGEVSVDWLKRLNIIRTFRSLLADPTHHATIASYFRILMPPLQSAVKDLRSQLAREACLTVAYMCTQFGPKADFFIEPMLNTLFTLLVANAKIVSTTASSTLLIIYESVPSFRLLPPLQVQMSSKSKEVRRAVVGVLRVILTQWPVGTVQKHAAVINEVMKKGLTDADAEARQSARDSFGEFRSLFPGNAKHILESLEPNQQRQVLASISAQNTTHSTNSNNISNVSNVSSSNSKERANGGTNSTTPSLSRQGSIVKKTSIPVLTARVASPRGAGTPQGRSASAIDMQAVNRARQQNYNTLGKTSPLRTMGRTNSSLGSNSVSPKYSLPPSSYISPPPPLPPPSGGTLERSRNRSRLSRGVSHSQPGSRSNSPSSKFAYATYTSPYSQQATSATPGGGGGGGGVRRSGRLGSSSGGEIGSPYSGSGGGGGLRRVSTSSANSSRETSPQGRVLLSSRSRSISNSPQLPPLSSYGANSTTAKMLMASREAESALAEALRRRDELESGGGGGHSDSEDSASSHPSSSYRSETFSPPSSTRHLSADDNVEELLNKCGSAKWSERKDGLCGLNAYLQRHGSLPPAYFNRIGQTFCRIFMDAHTKVLSLFLDVLHSVLLHHARDLVDFTTILLNRVLTKLGSDLLTSVYTKLMKTLEIIMNEMPPDLQFSAVAHYLCDPTQTPNCRSRVAALVHLYNLSSLSIPVKTNELQLLVDKLLDWCGDMRSQELRKTSQQVLRALVDMNAPQMMRVLAVLPGPKQDQAKSILDTHSPRPSPLLQLTKETVENVGWNSLTSEIQALRLGGSNNSGGSENVDVMRLLSLIRGESEPHQRSFMIAELFNCIKETSDEKLLDSYRDLLKFLFNVLTAPSSSDSDKTLSFSCLQELCTRSTLAPKLAEYTELCIVRVTEVQSGTGDGSREVGKAAECCGLALAGNFPPEIVARAVCPIVSNKDFPVNQLAIKMLQRLVEVCDERKLESLLNDIMTTLITAYDHPDSAVRKAAVFAIVAVHSRVGKGNALDPYLSSLNVSKLRLLQLYIQRAQNNA